MGRGTALLIVVSDATIGNREPLHHAPEEEDARNDDGATVLEHK